MPRVSISVGTEPWWQENSVMMATMLMEMGAVGIAESNKGTHAQEDHQNPKIYAIYQGPKN